MSDQDSTPTEDLDSPLEDAPSWYGDDTDPNRANAIRSALEDRDIGFDLGGDQMPVEISGYRLEQKVGTGGMGSVFRATSSDGKLVAVKVLHPHVLSRQDALTRFERESKMLATVEHPNLTRWIEVGCAGVYHYLVIEYVDGPSLARLLGQHGRLSEHFALMLTAQVAAGLSVLHPMGIIHRDIKPGNLLIRRPANLTTDLPTDAVKVADFGLARSIHVSGQSRVTRSGVVVGTPQYMSPEQCTGSVEIAAASDVYSMAATLFHMLCGRPPFEAETTVQLIDQQRFAVPPRADRINTAVSEAVADVIERGLAKRPSERHANASEFLEDVQSLIDGNAIQSPRHPRLPSTSVRRVMTFELHCDLRSSPAELWPYVSDTDRMNCATGLPPVRYETKHSDQNAEQYGNVGWMGLNLRWREYPYEWVERRKLAVLRVLKSGPVDWLASTVELHPRADGGTHLIHRFDVHARGWFRRWLARKKIGGNTRRSFERVYRRIDAVLSGDTSSLGQNPFEPPHKIASDRRRLVDRAIDRIRQRMDETSEANVLLSLRELILQGSAQETARMRPFELARSWRLPISQVTTALLYAAADGLLELRWEIHCPICRVPTTHRSSLADVENQIRCEVCNVDVQTDLAHAIELSFNVAPKVRRTESRTYCIGGPAHSPHILSQVRIAAGERCRLDLELCRGEYRLTSRQLASEIRLIVDDASDCAKTSLALNQTPVDHAIALATCSQSISLRNETDRELVIRLERTLSDQELEADRFTASRAAASELFRNLFPAELLAVDQPVNVPRMTFLAVRLTPRASGLGDVEAVGALREQISNLRRLASDHQGTLLKTIGNTSVCVIPEASKAVEMVNVNLRSSTPDDWVVRAAIHRGHAILATIDGRLEFFGEAFEETLGLPAKMNDDEVHVSQDIARELNVESLSRFA